MHAVQRIYARAPRHRQRMEARSWIRQLPWRVSLWAVMLLLPVIDAQDVLTPLELQAAIDDGVPNVVIAGHMDLAYSTGSHLQATVDCNSDLNVDELDEVLCVKAGTQSIQGACTTAPRVPLPSATTWVKGQCLIETHRPLFGLSIGTQSVWMHALYLRATRASATGTPLHLVALQPRQPGTGPDLYMQQVILQGDDLPLSQGITIFGEGASLYAEDALFMNFRAPAGAAISLNGGTASLTSSSVVDCASSSNNSGVVHVQGGGAALVNSVRMVGNLPWDFAIADGSNSIFSEVSLEVLDAATGAVAGSEDAWAAARLPFLSGESAWLKETQMNAPAFTPDDEDEDVTQRGMVLSTGAIVGIVISGAVVVLAAVVAVRHRLAYDPTIASVELGKAEGGGDGNWSPQSKRSRSSAHSHPSLHHSHAQDCSGLTGHSLPRAPSGVSHLSRTPSNASQQTLSAYQAPHQPHVRSPAHAHGSPAHAHGSPAHVPVSPAHAHGPPGHAHDYSQAHPHRHALAPSGKHSNAAPSPVPASHQSSHASSRKSGDYLSAHPDDVPDAEFSVSLQPTAMPPVTATASQRSDVGSAASGHGDHEQKEKRWGLHDPISGHAFTTHGENAPYKLPCGHTFTLATLRKMLAERPACPFDGAPFPYRDVGAYEKNKKVVAKIQQKERKVSTTEARVTFTYS